MRALPGGDHASVVRRINATLQGPVVDILGDLVPELRRIPRRDALQAILDDVDLLHACFQAFRANPDNFAHVLVNKHKVSVEDAQALLECGRSLDQVIAMVVRSAAKRHFRRRLDGVTKPLRRRPKARRDLMARMMALFARPKREAPLPRSRGDILYEVFQDYLLHDWQVPIIPEYCQMPPALVRRLGERILDYRIAEDIRRLRADPDNPPAPTPVVMAGGTYQLPPPVEESKPAPAPITVADQRVSDGMAKLVTEPEATAKDERARLSDVLTADGKRLKASAFTIVLLDPKVRSVLPDSAQTVRITAILGIVNGQLGKLLVGELGLRTDQLAIFVMAAHAALGDDRFEKAFGVPGRPDYMAKLVDRAKAAGIGQHSDLKRIATFVTGLFAAAEAAQKKG
ncbi:hypothetical protein [Magnetospirillum sp. UT-4]|uniref:hypothetical protein n=1 Tax=Magnetospirillum sp. UT-4 TaxID=2681467 RepID=UPI00137C8A38|nr:hypothetical protein [Magnetospirillum sp. UT-4]CAA7616910.1 conserved hypothetical protein [Magnetospirillum sp. UT-4]